jgi:hypothetical protein
MAAREGSSVSALRETRAVFTSGFVEKPGKAIKVATSLWYSVDLFAGTALRAGECRV